MSLHFTPDLSVLDRAQRLLWEELHHVPDQFVLCGGTAIAIQLGHRQSVDFDFFGSCEFDPDQLYRQVEFLRDSTIQQKSANTLSCLIHRDGDVQVSFFGVPELNWIASPLTATDNKIAVASMIDLAGLKTAVIQKRAEAKDYFDLDAIFESTEIGLPVALSAGKILYGESFNPEIALKALSYFDDGNLSSIPQEVRSRLSKAVQQVNPMELPDIDAFKSGYGNKTDGDVGE